MSEEKEMTKEEYQKMMEERRAAWEAFITELKNNSEMFATKGDLLKVIDYISEDIGSMAQMSQMMMQNMNALNHNQQQIMSVLGGGKAGHVANKTPGGIILPH